MLGVNDVVRSGGDLWLAEHKAVELEARVLGYMREIAVECVDRATGELNTTELAERAANEFDLHASVECDVPQDVYDWAIEAIQAEHLEYLDL